MWDSRRRVGWAGGLKEELGAGDNQIRRYTVLMGKELCMDKEKDADAAGVFDRADLLDTVGGDTGMLEELVDMFLMSVPDQMEKIGAALKEGDYFIAQREAHRLKGTSANMRAPFLHTAFADLEVAAKEQDPSRAVRLLVDCRKGFDHFVEVYRTGF